MSLPIVDTSLVSRSGINCVIRENVGALNDIHEDTPRHTKDNFSFSFVFLCVLCASVVNCLVVAEGYVAHRDSNRYHTQAIRFL